MGCALRQVIGKRNTVRLWKSWGSNLEGRQSVAFFHPQRDVRIIVQGDDFVIDGEQSDLGWVRDVVAAKYLLKVRGILGAEPCDQKSTVILGRAVEWRGDELWWEADPRHVEKMLEVCGM